MYRIRIFKLKRLTNRFGFDFSFLLGVKCSSDAFLCASSDILNVKNFASTSNVTCNDEQSNDGECLMSAALMLL